MPLSVNALLPNDTQGFQWIKLTGSTGRDREVLAGCFYTNLVIRKHRAQGETPERKGREGRSERVWVFVGRTSEDRVFCCLTFSGAIVTGLQSCFICLINTLLQSVFHHFILIKTSVTFNFSPLQCLSLSNAMLHKNPKAKLMTCKTEE